MIRVNPLAALQLMNRRELVLPLLAIPVLTFCWVLYQWGQNVPFNDDIPDILAFLLSYIEAESPGAALEALFAPHNDHRTSASRLIYVLAYELFGEINFRSLSFIANGAVFALLMILSSYCQRREQCWLLLLSLALLLLQPRAFGPMFFVMSGFAFYMVNVYGLASLKLLGIRSPLAFSAAIVFATLATFSLASGQLIWPVGLAWLLYQSLREEAPDWRYPIIWLLAAAVILFLYQWGWDKPNTAVGLLGLLAESPVFVARFALAIMGSALAWDSTLLAELAGLSLLLTAVWLSWRGFREGLSTLHVFVWYIVGQSVVIAMGRAPYAAAMDNSMAFALVPRYSWISLCLLAPVLLLVIERVRGSVAPLAALLFSLCFCTASYAWYLPQVQAHWEHRLKFYNQGQFRLLGMPLKESNAIVQRAVDAGIYRPPERPLQAGRPE